MKDENKMSNNAHSRAYVIDQILRFLQHITHEPARLFLFDRVEYCSAIPAAKQAGEELAVLAKPIIVINKEHPLTQTD